MTRELFHQWWIEEMQAYTNTKIATVCLLGLVAMLIWLLVEAWRKR